MEGFGTLRSLLSSLSCFNGSHIIRVIRIRFTILKFDSQTQNELIPLSEISLKILLKENNMKRLLLLTILVITIILMSGCGNHTTERNYRQDMRVFVQGISAYAKGIKPNFIIIPQNGHELLTENGEKTGMPAVAYLESIDGIGREDLFYGYNDDNVATPESTRGYMIDFMDIAEDKGIEVLVSDYCWDQSFIDDSYEKNANKGYTSFAADHRELNIIPSYPATPYNVNTYDITSLAKAKNFLYLINPSSFPNKDDFLNAIRETNYDIIIIDLFYGNIALTSSEVESLKIKSNGGSRLIIAYMSIGEAEDYRYYWQTEWVTNPPSWLEEENPEWHGNYKVRYWDKDWQNIIYENNDSYLKKILDAGFTGVYLDIIDAFEYFENL